MRNNRILISFLHVAHNANFFPALCIQQLYFITKMSTFGVSEYKVEESGCGFNRKRGLAETDS